MVGLRKKIRNLVGKSEDGRPRLLPPHEQPALVGEKGKVEPLFQPHENIAITKGQRKQLLNEIAKLGAVVKKQSLLDALETSIINNTAFPYNEPPELSSDREAFLYTQMHLPVLNAMTPQYRLMDHFNYIVQEDSNDAQDQIRNGNIQIDRAVDRFWLLFTIIPSRSNMILIPFMIAKEGWAALYIYLIVQVVFAYPLVVFHLSLGQYSGSNPTRIFGKLSDTWKGLNIIILLNVVLSITIDFKGLKSFGYELTFYATQLHRSHFERNICPKDDNSCLSIGIIKECLSGMMDVFTNDELPEEMAACNAFNQQSKNVYYGSPSPTKYITSPKGTVHFLDPITTPINIAIFTLLLMCLKKKRQTTTKFLYAIWTPIVMLMAVVGYDIMGISSARELCENMVSKNSTILQPAIWVGCILDVIYKLHLTSGSLIKIGTFFPFKSNTKILSMFLIIADTALSLLFMPIQYVLYLHFQTLLNPTLEVSNVEVRNMYSVGPTSQLFNYMNIKGYGIGSILFISTGLFIVRVYKFSLYLEIVFDHLKGSSTQFYNLWTKFPWTALLIGVGIIFAINEFILVQDVFEISDAVALRSTFFIPVIFFEFIIIFYMYGGDKFMSHMKLMMSSNKTMDGCFLVMYRIILPLILLFLFIYQQYHGTVGHMLEKGSINAFTTFDMRDPETIGTLIIFITIYGYVIAKLFAIKSCGRNWTLALTTFNYWGRNSAEIIKLTRDFGKREGLTVR